MKKNERQTPLVLDQIGGCMVGGAVGDALGYAVEFQSWSEIQRRYGEGGIREYKLDNRGLACISDDTQMSLFTAVGILVGMTRYAMRGLMGRIDGYCRFSYGDWLNTQHWLSRKKDEQVYTWLMDVPELYSRRAPGNTCLSALEALNINHEVKNNSCGCGGVMRTAPLALLNYTHGYADGDMLYCDNCAAGAARITHKHPLGFIPSAVLNHILMEILAMDKVDAAQLPLFVEHALDALPDIVSEEDGGKTYEQLWANPVKEQQAIVRKALDLAETDTPDQEAISSIGEGWTGHEALAIAIYSAVKHKESFEDAIVSSVNHSGDSDSTGAVCGNIIGCLLGRSAIPSKYTEKLELIDVIEEVAEDLYNGCTINEYNHYDTPENCRWFDKYCEMHWVPRVTE